MSIAPLPRVDRFLLSTVPRISSAVFWAAGCAGTMYAGWWASQFLPMPPTDVLVVMVIAAVSGAVFGYIGGDE